MAKAGRGQEGASRIKWKPPPADEIKQGDVLQFYSPTAAFRLRVLSLQHGGEWIFGYDPDEDRRLGPLAVRRIDCMTLETADRILGDLPTIRIEAPPPQEDV